VSKLFPHLFEPLSLRHKTLRHRLNLGAHTANMAEDGLPGERHLGYYSERARGGAAMIVCEPIPVHATGVLTRGNFRHGDDSVIPHFRRITDACHAYGSVMIHQIYHVGQHGDFDNSFQPAWSPSGLPSYHDSDCSHAMSEAQIEEIIEGFARAAGFDGVELFAAYHALIDQFWTPWSNRRDDRWGGGLENRVRFSSEIIARIRKRTGDDFIIGMAVSCDPDISVSLSLESLAEIVAWHDQRGLIDDVTCGTGSYFDFYKLMPTFVYADKLGAPFAEALKAAVSHARVQAESHIRTPENANTVIASGQADMVSIVRGPIADPHMAARRWRIDPATSAGASPATRCAGDGAPGTTGSPAWSILPRDASSSGGGDRFTASPAPRRVLVVGGGPGGMQPRRAQILDLLAWYEGQLQHHQVELRLNTSMEADEVASFGADAVVIATGSVPDGNGFQRFGPTPGRIAGMHNANVWSVEDVMARTCRPGKRILLLDDGGNWRGCGTAWHLAEQGYQVTLLTPEGMVGKELVRSAADFPLRMTLKKLGVAFITDAAIGEWHADAATIVDLLDGSERREGYDALILATPSVAETTLFDALAGSDLELHAVGDCVAPRWAVHAIYEGRKLGISL